MSKESFRAFASGMIDYAGLFPPAEMPMESAIRAYARDRRGPHGWLLGRFLCPAPRLEELAPFRESVLKEGEPYRLGAIARPARDGSAFGAALGRDLEMVAHFRERHRGRADVEAIEARIPDALAARPDAGGLIELFDTVADLLEGGSSGSALQVFYEAPFPSADWRQNVSWIIDAIGAHSPASWGYKLRCGGAGGSAVPSIEQAAFTILACRDAGVPLKATAGLHRPIRGQDEATGTTAHGFVNLFAASMLAWTHDLDEERIAEVLADEQAEDFVFDEAVFAWKDLSIASDQVANLRRGAILSFGSCSFEEPCEGLKALGLLQEPAGT